MDQQVGVHMYFKNCRGVDVNDILDNRLGKREKNVLDVSSRCLATFYMLEVPHALYDWHRVALAQMATEDVTSTQVQDGHLKSDQSWHTYTRVIMSWILCEDNNMGVSNRITGGTHADTKKSGFCIIITYTL